MALFTWPNPVTCGDEPPEVCDPIPYKETVRALRATDPDSRCEVDLVSEQHPAFPVIISDTVTEARSGSSTNPIPISLVQEYAGVGPVPAIAFKNIAGELAIWNPSVTCDNKKVQVSNGDFVLVDDLNSNIFDEDCIGTISDADYLVGAKPFTDCNGNTRLKLIFFLKDELCTYCS